MMLNSTDSESAVAGRKLWSSSRRDTVQDQMPLSAEKIWGVPKSISSPSSWLVVSVPPVEGTTKQRDEVKGHSSGWVPVRDQRAGVRADKQVMRQEDAITTAVPFHHDTMAVMVLVAGCAFLVMSTVGFVLYRKKKRSRRCYDDFPEDGGPRKAARLSIRSTDPIFYGCVTQDRPIDFVVPTMQAAGSSQGSLPSPTGDDVSLSSEPSPEIPLASRLSLTDNNNLMLPTGSSLLGGLNPELYKGGADDPEERDFPDGHRGRLWFGLDYDAATERLMVRVIKAKNLPSRVYGSINCCDPFVRIYLMPDERRYLQSKFKKKTCNPVFEENYIFQIPNKTMEERVLKFTILDNDRGKRHNPIGHVIFPLRELDITSGGSLVTWRDLEKEVDETPSDQGELLVSLCYNANLERLTVTVFEAKGLRPPDGINVLDSFVKLTFLMENKPVKSKKTVLAKKTNDPKYMESFSFRVANNALNTASVILKVNTTGGGQKDKCLGRVVLGSFMFARGKALQHWNEAITSAPRQVHQWHKLT